MNKELEESVLPFRKGNEFYWPTDFQESGYCLSRLLSATNKKNLFESGEFSEKLEKTTSTWDFVTVVKSALYYHLDFLKDSRKESNKPYFHALDWYTFILLFLNENTSKKEILDIFEYVYEAPDRETLLGVQRALSIFTVFSFVPISPESLNNLLIFLKIDIVSREVLIKKSFEKQNLDDLVDCLIVMECSVNASLVLTDSLSYYFETLEKEKPSTKEIEDRINGILDFTRIELETFNVFDIFESSEYYKSGTSQIDVFSFNEALLLSLIKNPSNTSLKVFELFESYLYQTKQKTIFLIKISFEKGSDLYQLISDFCLTREKDIKFYAKSDYTKSNFTLFSYVFRIIVGSLGLLLFFAASRSISTRTARLDQIKSKTLGNVAYVITREVDFEQVQTETEITIVSENIVTKDNKMVRTHEPSFASLIPHFSKNQVKASQPVPRTQPVALQSHTPVQVFQKVESTVRPIRSIPRSTTHGYGQVIREGLKRNYSMVSFQQSSIELQRVPFALQLPASHASTMNAMIEKLEYEYPGVALNVNQIYKKEGGAYIPTNKLSLFGTSLQYRDCSAVKQEFSTFVDSNNYSSLTNQDQELIPLEFANPGQLEGDHTKNVVQRQMLKLLPGESGSVFMGKEEHALIGKNRNFSMPDEIGYTSGTAGAMDLISFIEEDNASVIGVVFDQNNGEPLSTKGYDAEVISQAYKKASAIDREKVQEKIANSGVDENLFLAVNVNNMFDVGIAQNYDNFIELVDEKGIDCKRACDDLNNITARAAARRAHAFSVGARLKKDTTAWRNFNMHEERVKHSCERAYEYVAGMPGYSETYIEKSVKEAFFSNTSKNPMSLEEAFGDVTKHENNLKSLEKHPKALFGSRLYSPNQKKK